MTSGVFSFSVEQPTNPAAMSDKAVAPLPFRKSRREILTIILSSSYVSILTIKGLTLHHLIARLFTQDFVQNAENPDKDVQVMIK